MVRSEDAKEREMSMQWCIETVAVGSSAIECLRFGVGDDALVILPGASVKSVVGAVDAIVEAYASLAESLTVYLLDYRRALPDSCSVRTPISSSTSTPAMAMQPTTPRRTTRCRGTRRRSWRRA